MTRGARVPAVVLLAAGVFALALLLQATQPPQAAMPWAAPVVRAAGNPDTGPTLTLVSPSSGQGPVGAHLTVSGSGWTGGSVAVGAASSATNCVSGQTWTTTFATFTPSSGSFSGVVNWPSSLSSGTYALCAAAAESGVPAAAGGVAASQTYTVKASSPPALTLSDYTVQVGRTVTINGSNFVGVASVNLSYGNQSVGMTPIQTVNPDGNGNFAVQFTPSGTGVTGNVTIAAASSPDPGAQQPALSTTASLVIAAAPTATPSPSPSPSPTPTAQATSTSAALAAPPTKTDTSGGNGLIIFLIVGIVLSLLVILGAVAFLLLRRRGGPDTGYPGGPGGPGGGYSGTGPVTSYGQSATGYGPAPTGRYSTSGTYGRSGMLDVPEPYTGPQIGGVAQWEEPDPLPDPGWQPRPMSGSRARFDDPSYPQYPATGYPTEGYPGGQPGPGVPAPVPDYQGGYNGPPDPWASAAGAPGGDLWGGPPQAGRGPSRYGGGQPGQSPRDPWQQDDGGWATRPGQGQPGQVPGQAEDRDDGSGRWRTRPESPDGQW